jgi:hypothetical protein
MPTNPSTGNPPEKPTCHPRRHLTPSQFMTYDAMRAMAKEDDLGDLVCYAQLITITNRTSIGKTQNAENIKALVAKGWVIPQDKVRWRAGRWANNKYTVLEHADYEQKAFDHEDPYVMCPPFKFNEKTGENLKPIADADDRREFNKSDFAINAALARAATSRERTAFTAALSTIMREATPKEKEEWFRPAEKEDGE